MNVRRNELMERKYETMFGNKFAEKWNETTALDMIAKVQQYNESNVYNYHLGKALIECDAYPELWSALTNKFTDNAKVSKAIKKVEQYLEARIVNDTVCGEAKSASMAIFYLKNKHGYTDKKEVDQTHHVSPSDVESWADQFRQKD